MSKQRDEEELSDRIAAAVSLQESNGTDHEMESVHVIRTKGAESSQPHYTLLKNLPDETVL